jgi:hypothetical protein
MGPAGIRHINISRIVSGGQTGVDRAALDFAIGRGIEHGGWVPRGRKAEDGALPAIYRMTETKSSVYAQRTRKNVLDSDGTLIVYEGELSGGTALTAAHARRLGKPLLAIDVAASTIDTTHHIRHVACRVREWIVRNNISVLNVAGPRASQNQGIYGKTLKLLERVFFQ